MQAIATRNLIRAGAGRTASFRFNKAVHCVRCFELLWYISSTWCGDSKLWLFGPPSTRMVTRASGLWRVLRIDRRYSFHRYNRGSWCSQRLPNTIRRDQQHLPVYRFHVLCRNKIDPSKGFTMARLETDKKSFRLSEAIEVNAWLFSHHGLCTLGYDWSRKWYGERTKRYPSRLGSQTTLQ